MVKKKEEKKENNFKLDEIDGVGPTKMKRMEESGIRYIHDICMMGSEDIVRITGLDEPKSAQLWLNAKKTLQDAGVVPKDVETAREIYQREKNLPTMPSKCEAIDILFGGKGPKIETLTEVYGGFGSGKTQYIMSCVVEVVNNGDNVFILDCEKTFDIERMLEIANARGYIKNEDDKFRFLDGIILRRASNSTEMYKYLNNSTDDILKNNIKLFVIDGAIGQIRKEFLGRGELSVRQNYLKPLMTRLGSMPDYLNCWVIMSNQIQHDPSAMFTDPTKPIGGNIVAHEPTFRVYFKNYSDTKWAAKMVDSPHHAKLTMPFKLSNKGVEDIPDELRKSKKVLCNIEAKTFIENNLDKTDNDLIPLINVIEKIVFYNINYNIKELEVKAFRKEVQPKDYKANEGPIIEPVFSNDEGLKDKSLLLDTDNEITLSN